MLIHDFGYLLKELVILQAILDWLVDAVLTSERTEPAAREQSIKPLRAQHDQIQARVGTMYLDELDGRITGQLLAGERGSVASQVGDVRQFVTEA